MEKPGARMRHDGLEIQAVIFSSCNASRHRPSADNIRHHRPSVERKQRGEVVDNIVAAGNRPVVEGNRPVVGSTLAGADRNTAWNRLGRRCNPSLRPTRMQPLFRFPVPPGHQAGRLLSHQGFRRRLHEQEAKPVRLLWQAIRRSVDSSILVPLLRKVRSLGMRLTDLVPSVLLEVSF